MKVKLNRYYFNLSDVNQAKEYNALCRVIKSLNVKKFATLDIPHKGFPNAGTHEIDTGFVFENQYNTKSKDGHQGYRIFDWSEVIYPNKQIKEGYYLTDTKDLEAFKTQHYVCGYCGNRHNGHDAPINCTKCLGSKYLTEEYLPLTTMNPISGPKRQSTVSKEDYEAAQAQAKIERAKAQKARLLIKAEEVLANAERKIKIIQYEALEKAKILRQGHDIDNLIYYSHSNEWVLGWYKPVTQKESDIFRGLDLDIDVTIKMQDRTTI